MSNINLSGTIHHELQSKVITERINLLETCMGDLCENFGKISRKNARLRDTSDQMVTIIKEYSGKEQINSSSKKGLVNYSSFLSTVEDYRHAMIERVEKNIIFPLSKYHEYLKESRKTIKSTIQVRDKEKQKQQKLNSVMQRTPNDGRNIAQAQANAETAASKVEAQDKQLAEEIDKLEQKKLNDMKNVLKEYTHIQLIFHAKALEMLTVAYKHLVDIDTDNDLEEFRNTFTQSNLPSHEGSKHSLNESAASSKHNLKNSYDNLFSGSAGGSAPNTPGRSRASQGQSDQKRSKSNENVKTRGQRDNNDNNVSNSSSNKNMKSYGSAPNLNKKRDTDEDLEVEDMTDDSDEE